MRNFSSSVEKIFHEWAQQTRELFFNTSQKCLTARENTASWLVKYDITRVWIINDIITGGMAFLSIYYHSV